MVFVAITHIAKDEWRSTVAFCYLVENVARFIYLVLIRKVVNLQSEYLVVVAMIVSSVIGLAAGNELAKKVNQTVFRRLIVFILAAGSLLMVTSGLETWLMAVIMSIGLAIFAGYGLLLFAVRKRHQAQYKVIANPETIKQIPMEIEIPVACQSSDMTPILRDSQEEDEEQGVVVADAASHVTVSLVLIQKMAQWFH